MSTNGHDPAGAVRDAVYRSALLLDAGETLDWLDRLCGDDFEYTITTYSPEVRREQEWFGGNRAELVDLVRLLPKHNSDHGPLARHVNVYTVDVAADGQAATAVSAVAIYQTLFDGQNSHLDAGTTRLLCTGKYHDVFRLEGGQPVLQSRTLRLDTRQWGTGSHAVL